MALPVTITGISTTVACVGPFKSSGGNYYFFGRDGTTATTLQAYKSTAPDTSWSSIATKTGFTTAILNLAAYQVSDVIHILVNDGTAATSVATKYVSFDTSNDTFLATTETVAAAAANTGQAGVTPVGCSLVVRSNGEVVAFYNGVQTKTSGTFYARIYYRRRTAVNTWSAETEVDANTAVDSIVLDAAIGTSDAVHFFYKHTSTQLTQRTLSSANALQTKSGDSTQSVTPIDYNAASYDNAGTQVVMAVYTATDAKYTPSFNSANTPTLSTSTLETGGSVARLFFDGGDANRMWALYRNSADSDLYTENGTVSFGTKTLAMTATVVAAPASLSIDSKIYQRVSNVVIPYIVNDNGTLKYNEYTVRTAMGPARVDLALSGTAPTSAQVIPSNPARCDLALSTTAPSASVVAPGINISPARVDLAISGSQAAVGVVKGLNAADLVFSTTAPTAQTGANVIANPARVDLALSPTAPMLFMAIGRDPARRDLVLSPTAPTAVLAVAVNIPQGNLALTAAAPAVSVLSGLVISPARVDLAISPSQPAIGMSKDLNADDLILSPTAPTVQTSGAAAISPARVDLVLTQTAPAVSVLSGLVISPPTVNLAITPTQPAIGTAKDLNAGNLSISATAPTVSIPTGAVSRSPPAANLAISSLAPDAGLASDIPIGQLVISTTAPTRSVVVAGTISMSPARVDLAISGSQPAVGIVKDIASDDLLLSYSIPTVTVSAANNTTITPDTRDLAISCTAPTVLVTVHASVAPSTRDLVLSTTAPSVALAVTSCIILPPSVNLLLSTTAASSIRTAPPPRQFVRYVRPMTHIMRRW